MLYVVVMTAKRYLIVPMLAILFVLAFVAQSLAITAFGGPVRRGHDQKTEIVLNVHNGLLPYVHFSIKLT